MKTQLCDFRNLQSKYCMGNCRFFKVIVRQLSIAGFHQVYDGKIKCLGSALTRVITNNSVWHCWKTLAWHLTWPYWTFPFTCTACRAHVKQLNQRSYSLLKCLLRVDRSPDAAISLLTCHYTMKKRWSRLFFQKLCVHIKDNNSPHGKFHRFLFPFSTIFPHLNFALYVLYIYLCYENRMSHKQWAWVTCGQITVKSFYFFLKFQMHW